MADNNQKILTREDLLYILNSIFALSREPNNAFQMLEDGLYVEDYKLHSEDADQHIDADIKAILTKLSVTESGILNYDNKTVGIVISADEGNAVEVKPDGIYVKIIPEKVQEHLDDSDSHVSEEDRESWNKSLQDAKDYVDDEIGKLVIINIEEVLELPDPIGAPSTTLYVLKEDESTSETEYTLYINIKDKFVPLSITKRTLDLYLTKKEIEDKYCLKEDAHNHERLEVLEKLSEDTDGNLVYNGLELSMTHVSEKPDNAIRDIEGKWYVKDLESEIRSLQLASQFNKVNLLNGECTEAGIYDLKENINNFNLLLIEYYYKPDDETKAPGYAKTATVDVDTLNELHEKGIDYCIELGYGITNSTCKFFMENKTLTVNYYHNICIYKITGIGRVGEE